MSDWREETNVDWDGEFAEWMDHTNHIEDVGDHIIDWLTVDTGGENDKGEKIYQGDYIHYFYASTIAAAMDMEAEDELD